MTSSRGIQRSTTWRNVPRVNDDDARAQHALADVIRERLGLLGRSQASVYRALGMPSSTWQNYFKTCDREVPYWVIRDTARELGLTAGQLVARAELRESELAQATTPAPAPVVEDDDTTRELMAGMSPRNQRKVQAIREAHAKANPPKGQDKRKRKPT